MDVKFINPFLEGTVEVLKTMAFVNPRPGKPYLKKGNLAKGDVSGIIGLTGAVKGSLALSFSSGSILKIVSNMLGEEMTSINGDIRDAVGGLPLRRWSFTCIPSSSQMPGYSTHSLYDDASNMPHAKSTEFPGGGNPSVTGALGGTRSSRLPAGRQVRLLLANGGHDARTGNLHQ